MFVPTCMCQWSRVSVKDNGTISERWQGFWLAAQSGYNSCTHCSCESEGKCFREIWGTVKKEPHWKQKWFLQQFEHLIALHHTKRPFYSLHTVVDQSHWFGLWSCKRIGFQVTMAHLLAQSLLSIIQSMFFYGMVKCWVCFLYSSTEGSNVLTKRGRQTCNVIKNNTTATCSCKGQLYTNMSCFWVLHIYLMIATANKLFKCKDSTLHMIKWRSVNDLKAF